MFYAWKCLLVFVSSYQIVNSIFISSRQHFFLLFIALKDHLQLAAKFFWRLAVKCICMWLHCYYKYVSSCVRNSSCDSQVTTYFDRLPKVNISDVLNMHFLAASKPRSHNPAWFNHFSHKKPSEYFVMNVPLLHMHESNIAYHSFLCLDTLFSSSRWV